MQENQTKNLPSEIAVRREKAAKMFDVSPSTFDNWIKQGWMPEGIKIGLLRRWDTDDMRSSWNAIKEARSNTEADDDDENPFDDIIG
jgi:predicted DNA-binding transcriptional regulator AlpA